MTAAINAPSSTVIDLVMALDASSSVSGTRLRQLRAAGRTLLDALDADDRVALLTFSHVVTVREALTGDAGRVGRAMDAIEPDGGTPLVDGAYAAMMPAEPGAVRRRLVIVFSDGQDTSSWLPPERVIESAHSSDATIYAVAVCGARRPEFLRTLALVTGGSVIEIESIDDLGAHLRPHSG
jgi:Mg-chelatase subunit ChlD